MLDNFSLDQLRTFIAAADAGSFSAAGRRLNRAQSVVSQTVANLEAQLGLQLFDRAGRYPVPTDAGRALLAEARAVVGGMDQFKARAKSLAGGLEPELIVVVDVMFPTGALTCAIVAFQTEFPATPLRMYVEALGATLLPVLDGTCSLGVTGSLELAPPQLTREGLRGVKLGMVVSPRHELAAFAGPIPTAALSRHVQLVLTDRSDLSRGREFGVLSPKTWRLADLSAKHEFLRAGLGWGAMPLGMVAADLANGTLIRISLEDVPPESLVIPMSAIYRTESPPGPAGRWLIDRLKQQPDSEKLPSPNETAVFTAG
jgi:DNA-binding transcriptional LysR family regulator